MSRPKRGGALFWRRRREKFINAQTMAVSHGPLQLDVDMARRWGWTEAAIESAYDQLCGISARRTSSAQRRYPGRWQWLPGVQVWQFVGPPPLGRPPRPRRGRS